MAVKFGSPREKFYRHVVLTEGFRLSMFPIIGIVVVLGCIAGGYLIEKGNLLVLMQPAELLIILPSSSIVRTSFSSVPTAPL